MNNKKRGYDGDIVNSILVIILLCLIIIGIPITVSLKLNFPYLWYMIIGIIIVVFIRLKLRSLHEKKLEKEKQKLYGFDKEESFNFTIYYPKMDKDNLIQLSKIISNNKITKYDFIYEHNDLENYFENMEFIIGIDWKAELEDIVFAINDLCRKLDYEISLSENDIIKRDNQAIKARREGRMITAKNDINVATDILRKQNYEIIGLWINGDTYNISIIPVSKIEEMKKIK